MIKFYQIRSTLITIYVKYIEPILLFPLYLYRFCTYNNEKLYWAINNGYTNIANKLIDIGTDIHADNDYAIYRATLHSNLQLINKLIEAGANIHASDERAFLIAVSNGNLEIIKLFIDKGANIHIEDDSPIIRAAYNGNIEVVKLLVNNGANIHVFHNLPLVYAVCKNNFTLTKFFLDLGADPDKALLRAVSNSNHEIIKLLCDNGANIHMIDDMVIKLAIELATKKGRTEVVNLLMTYYIERFVNQHIIKLLIRVKI